MNPALRAQTPSPALLAAPAEEGWLDRGDGHRLWFKVSGPAHGLPVLVLHGGPASGSSAAHLRFFDLSTHRVVQCDQRGCGRSLPLGALEANTTEALVADIDALRRHLGIGRWLVLGGSWGASLGLAYAATHRAHCLGLLLRGSFLTGEPDLRWFLGGPAEGAGALRPQAWAQLVSLPGLHTGSRAAEVLAVHADAIEHGWQALHNLGPSGTADVSPLTRQALTGWMQWEQALSAPGPTLIPPDPCSAEALRQLLAKYRIQLHYLQRRCFLGEAALLDAAASLTGLPGLVLHGQLDLVCRPRNAWLLHQAWPGSVLHWVGEAGHDPFGPAMLEAMQTQLAHLSAHGAFAAPGQGLTP